MTAKADSSKSAMSARHEAQHPPGMCIRTAQASDCEQLAAMCAALWPDGSAEEHARELLPTLSGKPRSTLPLTIFVAEIADDGANARGTHDEGGPRLIGFLEVGLRSHADGCDSSHGVAFIEGWYVVDSERRRGVGRELVAAAGKWARSQGCVEMASDTWINNATSQTAHQAQGFEEVDRCVHYRKSL